VVLVHVFFAVIRDRAFFLAALGDVLAAGFLDDVDIAGEFSVLTDRHMKRCNPLPVQFAELLDDFTVGNFIIVHSGHENHARKFSFFAEIPCFLGSDLDAVLAGYADDGGIGNTGCLFHFSYKIEVPRCIQDVDLILRPFDRNERSCN